MEVLYQIKKTTYNILFLFFRNAQAAAGGEYNTFDQKMAGKQSKQQSQGMGTRMYYIEYPDVSQ